MNKDKRALHIAKAILAEGMTNTPDRLWEMANTVAKIAAMRQARAAITAYEDFTE